jgi:hypothetical protein
VAKNPGPIEVRLLDGEPIVKFIGAMGELADRSNDGSMSGPEVSSEITQALETLTQEILSGAQ